MQKSNICYIAILFMELSNYFLKKNCRSAFCHCLECNQDVWCLINLSVVPQHKTYKLNKINLSAVPHETYKTMFNKFKAILQHETYKRCLINSSAIPQRETYWIIFCEWKQKEEPAWANIILSTLKELN